jgi:glycine cleavage system H lipoate-binding protein
MDAYSVVQPELFGTKGIEYLVVIGFLLCLTAAWRLIRAPEAVPAGRGQAWREDLKNALPVGRFPGVELFFHPGHSWARMLDAEGEVLVGWDDFARRLIGPPEGFRFPSVGSRIQAGRPAWSVASDGRVLPMVAPVDGEVVEINDAVVKNPDLAGRDPYGDGWLMRVRIPSHDPVRRNLLSGPLARSWAELAERSLQGLAAEAPDTALGAVLADGGEPRAGLARTLAPEDWEDIVSQFLLIGPSEAEERPDPRR